MGKIVLVTGCRSGFGLRIAADAARAGHTVYASLRDLDTAGDLRRETAGLDVTPLQLDVTDAEQRQAAVDRILAEAGRVDALINNAGVALGGPLEVVSEEELRQVFDVNVFGLWALTKACLPAMRRQGRGRIINISSMSGRQGLPLLGAYASSKFALEGMSEAWRHELSPHGIDVVLVEPGAYRTDIFDRNRRVAADARTVPAYEPLIDAFEALYDRIVDGRAGDPAEVSALVVDLLIRRRPALRYPIGPATRVREVLMRVLPQRALESVVQTAIKLAGGRP